MRTDLVRASGHDLSLHQDVSVKTFDDLNRVSDGFPLFGSTAVRCLCPTLRRKGCFAIFSSHAGTPSMIA